MVSNTAKSSKMNITFALRLLLGVLLFALAPRSALADSSNNQTKHAAPKGIVDRLAGDVISAGRRLVAPRMLNEAENNDGDCDFSDHHVTFSNLYRYRCRSAGTNYVDAVFRSFDHAVSIYVTDEADCSIDPDSSGFLYHDKLHADSDVRSAYSNLGPYTGPFCFVFDCNNWINDCSVRSTINVKTATTPTPNFTPTPTVSPTTCDDLGVGKRLLRIAVDSMLTLAYLTVL